MRQDEIKDIGGFVGGHIEGGRRLKSKILYRSVLTLDLDFAPSVDEVLDNAEMLTYAAVIYSTHKHSSEEPRLRLVMPLSRHVDADEYEAIGRKVASWFDIEWFDPTTFQPSRLMYWPSASSDGETINKVFDGCWIDADEVLALYHDWKDTTQWPVHAGHEEQTRNTALEQGDPLMKSGLIGAFCRMYTIQDAILKFIPDVYEQGADESRWSYLKGTTANGLVIYEDKFAYSHHGTDPVSGKLCNAWDIVRLHKFGNLDNKVKEGTPAQDHPSFKAMADMVKEDGAVRRLIGEERQADAMHIFAEGEAADTAIDNMSKKAQSEEDPNKWLEEMEMDRNGVYMPTINNVLLILENDLLLRGTVGYDELRHRETMLRALPWKKYSPRHNNWQDSDDAALRHYIEYAYGIASPAKIADALSIVMKKNCFHPITEWLDSLHWDGVERLDTLLIDYMGAEDSEYVRAVTRKTFTAAVARVYDPGCKFDTMLVLIGAQGLGKSTLIHTMGGNWFSDTFESMKGKEAMESLQGVWIMEVSELSALKKADIEAVKHFIAKQIDEFRVAYGKRKEYFPRQCIFIGTTNEDKFLKDVTGNRRFWPVRVEWSFDRTIVDKELVHQLWAEAVVRYFEGEKLWLDDKQLAAAAKAVQNEHMELDPRIGMIDEYLDTKVPAEWKTMNIYERRSWWQGVKDEIAEEGTLLRNQISVAEIYCELLNGSMKEFTPYLAKEVHGLMLRLGEKWEYARKQVSIPNYGRQTVYLRIGSQ